MAISRIFEFGGIGYVFMERAETGPVSASVENLSFEGTVRRICPDAMLFWLEHPDGDGLRVNSIQNYDPSGKPRTGLISLEMNNADLRYALKAFFTAINANYALDQIVEGTVTCGLHRVDQRIGLETILRCSAIPLTFRVEDNVYSISPMTEVQPNKPEAN
jgi:hypothetical protein